MAQPQSPTTVLGGRFPSGGAEWTKSGALVLFIMYLAAIVFLVAKLDQRIGGVRTVVELLVPDDWVAQVPDGPNQGGRIALGILAAGAAFIAGLRLAQRAVTAAYRRSTLGRAPLVVMHAATNTLTWFLLIAIPAVLFIAAGAIAQGGDLRGLPPLQTQSGLMGWFMPWVALMAGSIFLTVRSLSRVDDGHLGGDRS